MSSSNIICQSAAIIDGKTVSRRRLVLSVTIIFAALLNSIVLPGRSRADNDERPAPARFSAEQLEFFETKVRPLLAQRCYKCHSERSESLKGSLRLDGRQTALDGGDSGPAVVPGKPDKSLLIEAVRWGSLEMPPDGKLKPREIETLERWIRDGAAWPEDGQPQASKATGRTTDTGTYDWEHWRREHWAFQPVQRPEPPAVHQTEWVQSELDAFVLARLERAGLRPAAPAEPRVLLRRIYLDLVGMPPTPAAARSFIEHAERDREEAVRSLVDQLLASPHYGERWGRHWLDVARYSDGFGGFLDNAAHAQAWRYRDWVVQALNQDMPYDEFLRSQIAGDLTGEAQRAIATGLFALGPAYRSDGGDPDSVAQAKAETLSDRIDTLGRGLLGLTIACARCHDHKFDPIPQKDYYSLAGVFQNTASHEIPLAPQQVVDQYNRHQAEIAELDKRIKQLDKQIQDAKREATPQEQDQRQQWTEKLDQLRKTAPPKYPTAHALRDSGSADMHVAIRGDLRKPGELAPRRFLEILRPDASSGWTEGSGRRELAEAVADRDNPLTMRVFVNRVWLFHFGKALVRSPSNFGKLGEPPTHPQLLDWLTASFIESGLSIKSLHRTILLSSTYQMSSAFDERAFQMNGDNRLLWRMNPRRLDVEAWRDSLLTVTGELDTTIGGPPHDRVDTRRRTLYFKVSRNGDLFATDEFLRLFDFPLMRASVEKRPVSVVPQQFLFLMNSPFILQRAEAFVKRLESECETDEQRIELAYQILYQREPRPEERAVAVEFLAAARGEDAALPAWQQYAQVLLSSNELMYVR